jgi:putative transcriptional regulator
MEPKALSETISDDMVLYALGILTSQAAQAFATNLQTRDQRSPAALRDLEGIVGLLGYSAPAVAPPARLKAQLLARVQAEIAPPAPTMLARLGNDFTTLSWEPTPWQGVALHWLRQEPSTGTLVAFIKIQPGCHYPLHRHRGGEYGLVLQGGFRDQRGIYHAGDFVYYEPDSVHEGLQSLPGVPCILFVIAYNGLDFLPTQG